jgi:hypothetical protein
VLLGRRLDAGELHQLIGRRPATPQRVDQTADADSPHPGGHLAPTVPPPGRPPDRHERVLHDLVDELRRRATPPEPHQQPRQVAPIQLGERLPVAVGDRREELGVLPRIRWSRQHA